MNEFINKIIELSNNNKYTKWYVGIISNAMARSSSRKEAKRKLGYIEGHHIIPVSFKLGSERDKNNIAYLTAREHLLCHICLTKMLIRYDYTMKMKHALKHMLSVMRYDGKLNSKIYEKLKIEYSLLPPYNKGVPMAEEHRLKLIGLKTSEETKMKISKAKIGISVHTQESRDKISKATKGEKNGFYGKKHTVETRKIMSEKSKGVKKAERSLEHRQAISRGLKKFKPTEEQLKRLEKYTFKGGEDHPWYGGLPDHMFVTCEYCAKRTSKGLHTRWHGDKCKFKSHSDLP